MTPNKAEESVGCRVTLNLIFQDSGTHAPVLTAAEVHMTMADNSTLVLGRKTSTATRKRAILTESEGKVFTLTLFYSDFSQHGSDRRVDPSITPLEFRV